MPNSLASFSAEDRQYLAECAARDEAERRYYALQADLAAAERATGCYLADQNIDRENICDLRLIEGSAAHYNALYAQACSAAGMRAEETGLDINTLLGRVIY